MTFWTLIRRSLRFHARAHFGVVLGAAIGSAALIGAMVVGDSVRGSLRERGLEGLGKVEFALSLPDRFVTETLVRRLPGRSGSSWSENGGSTRVFFLGRPVAALVLPALAAREDGEARANRVNLIGVGVYTNNFNNTQVSFWDFAERDAALRIQPGDVWLNEPLAAQLHVRAGDNVVLRIKQASATSGDVAISPRGRPSEALRLRVAGIRAGPDLGNFSLRPAPTPPLNAFVNLQHLQEALDLRGRVNTVVGFGIFRERQKLQFAAWSALRQLGLEGLIGGPPGPRRDRAPAAESLEHYAGNLKARFKLSDLEATLSISASNNYAELKSRRVFLDPPIAQAALAVATNARPLLTYLANVMVAGTNATPYSIVTAGGPPWTPAGMGDDEILVNSWLAADLGVRPGDTLGLGYFEPETGARLEEATNRFRIRAVVPMEPPWADRTLMPDFPGIESAERASDWDAGFPLVHKIRPQDEDYWKQYRGTPKAFVTLAAGQKLWGNRFGNLTDIRFPLPAGVAPAEFRDTLETNLLAAINPAELGLRFEPVREQAVNAAEQSQDFGQLFLGFSIFLVVAALLLMALLFQFGLEQRVTEIGTLLALGFAPGQVRRLFLREGAALALAGGILGALVGLGYAKAMLWGLTTVWRSAVGTSTLHFHATPMTLVIGLSASTLVAMATIWLALRRQARRPARELLAGEVQSPKSKVQSRGPWIAWVSGICAVGVVAWALAAGESANPEVFFSAGALLLVAGLASTAAWLGRLARAGHSTVGQASHLSMGRPAPGTTGVGETPGAAGGTPAPLLTLAGLGWRGCGRRRTRSLATVALLACGCFVVAAIAAFRLDANQNATQVSSGTGGFALIGEATIPVMQDLNSPAGREFFGLGERDLEKVNFVPFRVHEGDDASCLNLNRAQQPRLLGVRPELLAGRFTFAKVEKGSESQKGWELLVINSALRTPHSALDELPAIGDANSIQWALHKKVGDTIDYTDERGRKFKLRLVGAVANSILQGNLIIDAAEFVKRFPGESGHRMFLIDAPSNSVAQVSATLSRALQDAGLELTPAVQRLNAFNAVQNTYLGTFQVLGGLGLLLGSVGLGVVVLRNVLERRGELGLLAAVGFRRRELQGLVLSEHGVLLGLGLGLGIIAAAVAVLPAILSPAAQLSYGSLALTLGAVCANGLLWTWVATRYALRGNLLAALRNE